MTIHLLHSERHGSCSSRIDSERRPRYPASLVAGQEPHSRRRIPRIALNLKQRPHPAQLACFGRHPRRHHGRVQQPYSDGEIISHIVSLSLCLSVSLLLTSSHLRGEELTWSDTIHSYTGMLCRHGPRHIHNSPLASRI